jgi:glutamine amidotransferase
MCRLLGVTSSEPTDFQSALRDGPRSLAALSREHPDGWGIAVYDAGASRWGVDKGVLCAGDDERFHRLAAGSRGDVLVSHVRKKTIGAMSLENTHPFQRDRWVFAHNGTVADLEWLRSRSSSPRLAQIAGETDSELLFAWLLTCLDAEGLAHAPACERADRALARATREAREQPGLGAVTFLLSDGHTTYAHRFGRSMFLLERRSPDAVLVASERLTAEEDWETVEEGALVRVERRPTPHWRIVA